MPWLLILGAAAMLGLVALATHLLLTVFNRRGWVYYRIPDAPKGRSLGLIEETYQPSISHVVDQETLEDSMKDQTESGDPDNPPEGGLGRS